MRSIILTTNELYQVTHLKPGDTIEVNAVRYSIISIDRPENDVTLIFTDGGSAYIQKGKFSFAKRPKHFPWFSRPMHIESVRFHGNPG